jgi:hypothetical protein
MKTREEGAFTFLEVRGRLRIRFLVMSVVVGGFPKNNRLVTDRDETERRKKKCFLLYVCV